jgi:mannose-6-phosphate isomerase-like protein (cupin superfamily)
MPVTRPEAAVVRPEARFGRQSPPGGGQAYDLSMPTLIANPTVIEAAGNKPKLIREYIGRVNTRTPGVSVAHMSSPGGWVEPGQTPDFEEYTLVLRGMLRVTSHHGTLDVHAGQAVIAHQNEWVQYSTPAPEGADYVAICVPAFAPDIVHRDAER